AEDGIRDWSVTGVQTCALPISFPTRALPPKQSGLARSSAEAHLRRARPAFLRALCSKLAARNIFRSQVPRTNLPVFRNRIRLLRAANLLPVCASANVQTAELHLPASDARLPSLRRVHSCAPSAESCCGRA